MLLEKLATFQLQQIGYNHVTSIAANRINLYELKVGPVVYDEIIITSEGVITSYKLWYVDVPEGALLCAQVLAISDVSVQ